MKIQFVASVIVVLALGAGACARQPSGSIDSADSAIVPPSSPPSPARSDAERQIELLTDRATYRAGDPVVMTIVNHSTASWAFNPCTRIIERQTGGRWEAMPDARRCTMIAWILKPGESRTASTNFDSSLDTGIYRLVIGFSADGPSPVRQATAASIPVTITK